MCLRKYEFCLQFLHILRSFDALVIDIVFCPLLEVLDSCAYPFFFLVPLLDLLIFFYLHPKLCCLLEQVNLHVNLSLYLLYLRCCLMLPLLLHLWWSGRYELLPKVLDLMYVLIDCFHNLINLLCHREFIPLHALWDFIISYGQFLLHPICTIFLIFGLELSLLEYQFQIILIVPYLL
jgi:hypothetical protein